MCGARAVFSGHGLSQLGAGPVVVVTSGTTRGDKGFSSAFFLLCLKVVPESESFHLSTSQGRRLFSFQLTI